MKGMDMAPEDDDDFIPEMPEGYGKEYLDYDMPDDAEVVDVTEEEE